MVLVPARYIMKPRLLQINYFSETNHVRSRLLNRSSAAGLAAAPQTHCGLKAEECEGEEEETHVQVAGVQLHLLLQLREQLVVEGLELETETMSRAQTVWSRPQQSIYKVGLVSRLHRSHEQNMNVCSGLGGDTPRGPPEEVRHAASIPRLLSGSESRHMQHLFSL